MDERVLEGARHLAASGHAIDQRAEDAPSVVCTSAGRGGEDGQRPEIRVRGVAVLVGELNDAPADLVQLYARENGHRARDAQLFRGNEAVARVFDRAWKEEDGLHLRGAAGGEGSVMLAERLDPESVGRAIVAVHPWAVDASWKLELSPGIKDHERHELVPHQLGLCERQTAGARTDTKYGSHLYIC